MGGGPRDIRRDTSRDAGRPGGERWTGGRAESPRAKLPLLDRLIDDAPDVLRENPPTPAEAMAALRRSVRRDLEALLNARRRWRSWPQHCAELDTSPVGFGIPDFASGAFNDPRRRDELRAEIESTIRRFETRFTTVRVTLQTPRDLLETTLRLRIDAELRADPAPEPVAFDTVVDAAADVVLVRTRDDV